MNILEKRIKEKYPNENLEVLNYTIMKEPATIKCLDCGEAYIRKAETFVKKAKHCICTKCHNDLSGNRYDLISIQDRVKELFPKEKLKVIIYTNMKNFCEIQCLQCGKTYSFNRAENAFNKNKQSICKICRPNKIDIIENKRNNFIDFINNSIDFDLLPNATIDNYHSHDLVPTICLHCGKINFKYINDYLRERGCSCQCTNTIKSLEQINSEIDDDYEILEYFGMEHQAKIKHKNCGFIYNKSPKHYTCPKCGKVKSKGEKQIKDMLLQLQIDYLQEQLVVIENHNLRFDFYLPKYNTFIEFQGIQHFEPIAYFGGEEKFLKQKEYDNLKRQYCQKNGFQLIEITYKDLEENKIFDILKPLKFNDYLVREQVNAEVETPLLGKDIVLSIQKYIAFIKRNYLVKIIKIFEASQILQEKVGDICTKIPAFRKEIDWSRGQTREGKDQCRYVFKSGSTLENLAARESSRGRRFTAGIMEECVGIDQKILQEVIIPRYWGLNSVNYFEKPCKPIIRVSIINRLTGNERIPCQAR